MAHLVVWVERSLNDEHFELPEGLVVGQFLR